MVNDDNKYDHDDDDDNDEQNNADDEFFDEDYTNENENDDEFDYIKVKRKKILPKKKNEKNQKIQKGIIDYINN